jgi:hypothetical protein
MKKLVTMWVMVIVLLGWAGIAQPRGQIIDPTPDEAFINISFAPRELDLGVATFLGNYDSEAALVMKVESNCLHGSILASTDGFRGTAGGFIPAQRISVKGPATNGFVSMARPVAVSLPEMGSHNVVLNFRVQTAFQDREGKYGGTLTLTIMPPS